MRFRVSITLPALLAAASLAACSQSEEPQNAAVNPDLNTDTATTQTEGANSFTEEQARGHVENAGYTGVSPLTKTADGLWQGTAARNGETVNVSVDYRGVVTNTAEGEAPPMPATDGTTAPAATTTQNPAAMPGATSAETRRTGERG